MFRDGKLGIKRPQVDWEHVSTWNRAQVASGDYEGDIAIFMAKSLHDAKYAVTPRYNPRAISEFGFETVSQFQFVSKSFVACSVIQDASF